MGGCCLGLRFPMPNKPSPRRSHPVALLIAIAILAALAGIAYWLVLGSGVRACTTPFLSSYIRDFLSCETPSTSE